MRKLKGPEHVKVGPSASMLVVILAALAGIAATTAGVYVNFIKDSVSAHASWNRVRMLEGVGNGDSSTVSIIGSHLMLPLCFRLPRLFAPQPPLYILDYYIYTTLYLSRWRLRCDAGLA